MNFTLITCGLPGLAYHGGAVTCWAIVQAMRAKGHRVTVLSLFDNSDFNPYLESRDVQEKALYKIGVQVEIIVHNYMALVSRSNSTNPVLAARRKINTFLKPEMENFFPWAELNPQVQGKLEKIKPDAIFCYHFDALSAVYNTNIAPILAGVGDLWHLPGYFRWKMKKPSIRKYLLEGPYHMAISMISKRLMLKMLRSCSKRGAFAAHYAEWLRKHNGISDALYLRTSVHDSVGRSWERMKLEKESDSPLVLIIGDLSTTSTSSGLKYLVHNVLPILDQEFSKDGFEIHLVGGGKPQENLSVALKHPAIKLRGRITPADPEFLRSNVLFVPTPITLGIRVRIITAFSLASCVVAHSANAYGIPELKHEENCLLADSGKGLAKQVSRALKDKALRKKLGKNGRKTYERYFSEEAAAGHIVREMVEMVLNQKIEMVKK